MESREPSVTDLVRFRYACYYPPPLRFFWVFWEVFKVRGPQLVTRFALDNSFFSAPLCALFLFFSMGTLIGLGATVNRR